MEGARRRKIEGEKEGSSSEDEEADLNDEINTEEREALNEEKLLLKRLVQNGKRRKALEEKRQIGKTRRSKQSSTSSSDEDKKDDTREEGRKVKTKKRKNTVKSEGEISNESEEDAKKEKTMKQRGYSYDKGVNSKQRETEEDAESDNASAKKASSNDRETEETRGSQKGKRIALMKRKGSANKVDTSSENEASKSAGVEKEETKAKEKDEKTITAKMSGGKRVNKRDRKEVSDRIGKEDKIPKTSAAGAPGPSGLQADVSSQGGTRYKIPRRSVEESTVEEKDLVLNVTGSDREFFNARAKSTKEAPKDAPTIRIEGSSIIRDMDKVREEVRKLRPFDAIKLKEFEGSMAPCRFYNLDRCHHANVQKHSVNPGSFSMVAHICAVCHWSVNACEYHTALTCPMVKLRRS